MNSEPSRLLACPQCDCLHVDAPVTPAGRPCCRRCGASLHESAGAGRPIAQALAIAGMVMLIVAHLNPMLGLEVQGQMQTASIWEAVVTLHHQDADILGALVLATTLFFPAFELLTVIYLSRTVGQAEDSGAMPLALRLYQAVRPWVMVEVLMLGALIAVVKLASLGTIIPGAGMWSFGAVMLLIAASNTTASETA